MEIRSISNFVLCDGSGYDVTRDLQADEPGNRGRY
jgi:hypothetical protein